MSGITFQFANSPINKRIKRLTVGTTGTVQAFSGSSCLLWRPMTPSGNQGNIFIATLGDGSQYTELDASADRGWIPGNLNGYYWWGDTAGDAIEIWELE